jgi:hypothetical protein
MARWIRCSIAANILFGILNCSTTSTGECICPPIELWPGNHTYFKQTFCGKEISENPNICLPEMKYDCWRNKPFTAGKPIYNCVDHKDPFCAPKLPRHCEMVTKEKSRFSCMAGRPCFNYYLAEKAMKDAYGPNLEGLANLRSKQK